MTCDGLFPLPSHGRSCGIRPVLPMCLVLVCVKDSVDTALWAELGPPERFVQALISVHVNVSLYRIRVFVDVIQEPEMWGQGCQEDTMCDRGTH